MERLFGTLQSRLPPLMRQEGLASIAAANRWLATVYIPHHNTRFAVAPAEEGTAFVPFGGVLDDILCVQEERVVGNDNTVRSAGRVLQIPEQRHRRHFVKVTVRVHAYPDGRLALFHGPRRLADYRHAVGQRGSAGGRHQHGSEDCLGSVSAAVGDRNALCGH